MPSENLQSEILNAATRGNARSGGGNVHASVAGTQNDTAGTECPETSSIARKRQDSASPGLAAKEIAPKISVIVPVYKTEKYLPECIESILAQTFEDFELILVDDGSPDNSGAICDDYAARDPRIRVFHKENGGVSSARNLGIRNARAEYVAFLDSDDVWDLKFMEKMVNLIKSFPSADSFCCGWYCFCGSHLNPCSVFLYPLLPQGKEAVVDVFEFSQDSGTLPIWTGSVILRRSLLLKIGGFDETLNTYEDFDVWIEFCFRGKVAYHNEALAHHRLDSPVENKPRGLLPDLKKHWVSRLDKYSNLEKRNKKLKVFFDRFRLRALLWYRGSKMPLYDEILKKVDFSNADWKLKIIYRLPCFAGNFIIFLNRWLRKIVVRPAVIRKKRI